MGGATWAERRVVAWRKDGEAGRACTDGPDRRESCLSSLDEMRPAVAGDIGRAVCMTGRAPVHIQVSSSFRACVGPR